MIQPIEVPSASQRPADPSPGAVIKEADTGRVLAFMDGHWHVVPAEQITIPKLTAQVLFDALVHSMDFGSGFLDTEEVEALRGMAAALGVDPNDATPSEFSRHYPHSFVLPKWPIKAGEPVPCNAGWPACAKPESDPIHQAAKADQPERMSA